MPKKQVQKIVSRGLQTILSQRLKSDFSAYEGDALAWQGDTALTFTPSQTRTELPSGNDPAWDTLKGPVVGSVEITLYEFPIDLMPEILGMKYSEASGLCVGDSDDGDVFLGLSFDQLIKEGDKHSHNKTVLYKVCFDIPATEVKTIAKDDTAVKNVKLTGQVYPVFFAKADGAQGSRTYCVMNSVKNKTLYDKHAEAIVFPEEFKADD